MDLRVQEAGKEAGDNILRYSFFVEYDIVQGGGGRGRWVMALGAAFDNCRVNVSCRQLSAAVRPANVFLGFVIICNV